MPQFVEFNPTIDTPFAFSAVMGAATRQVSTPWSPYGQRFYVHMLQTDGATLLLLPLIGSPMARTIETMTWKRGKLDITFARPFGYDIGQTVRLTVRDCQPAVINGLWWMLVEDDLRVSFSLPADPGPITVLGSVGHDINITEGYVDDGTLVYRQMQKQFEVYP